MCQLINLPVRVCIHSTTSSETDAQNNVSNSIRSAERKRLLAVRKVLPWVFVMNDTMKSCHCNIFCSPSSSSSFWSRSWVICCFVVDSSRYIGSFDSSAILCMQYNPSRLNMYRNMYETNNLDINALYVYYIS